MQEIERKFLVDKEKLESVLESSTVIKQGYIPRGNTTTVRLRIAGDTGYLTLKGKTVGISRSEFEYEIPVEDAEAMLQEYCDQRLIDKLRYIVPFKGHNWEVDVFQGNNKGLIVAELELESEDEEFSKPDWVTVEVTDEKRYYNALLMDNPYSEWKDKE